MTKIVKNILELWLHFNLQNLIKIFSINSYDSHAIQDE